MTEADMSRSDIIRDYYRRHKIGKDPLANAPYELKDLGPFDNDPSGLTVPLWFGAMLMVYAAFVAYWVYYTVIQAPEYISLELLDQLNVLALAFSFIAAIAFIGVALDMHKGIAGAYKYILLLHMWALRRRKPIRPEWRVNDNWQLWNPITKKGMWRDITQILEEQDLEALKLERDKIVDEIAELKKAQKDALVEKAIEIELKRLGPRFSSVKELISAARLVRDAVKKERIKDDIKEVMAIRNRLMIVIEALSLDYFVTLLHIEGGIYPLVLSDLPLFGADDEGNAEFAIHELSVRSWLPWAARTVKNACLGSMLHLDDYRFHILPSKKLHILGQKEEIIKYSPIVYVVNSEGQVNRIKREHFHKEETTETPKIAPSVNEVIQAELVYSSTVADDALEKLKLVTAQDNKKNKSGEELRREYEAQAKDTVAEGLRLSKRTGKVGAGILGGLRLSLGSLPKYLFYSVIALCAVLGFVAILQSVGLIDLGWFSPPVPDEQEDDWGVFFDVLRMAWRLRT